MIVTNRSRQLAIPSGRGPWFSVRSGRALALVLVVIVGIGTAGWLARPLPGWVKEMTRPRASGQLDPRAVAEALAQAPRHFLDGLQHAEDLPRLRLDVKFRHWQKIVKKRNEAFVLRVLLAEDGDEVPATLSDGSYSSRVRIRLKGDLLDHLKRRQWSLRVKSEGPFFGMRRFSLQHPGTRRYAVGPLFLEHLRREDILAPRHRFVTLTVNGTDWGIMELEEHAAKELLEAQGRKEGVLGRLDDRAHWEHIALNYRSFSRLHYGPYNNYWTANFRAYGEKRLSQDPRLARNVALAEGLIARYQDGALTPGQVFDLDAFARYLVVSALWGDLHPQYFDNVRFYLNPYSLKVEPIAGDITNLRRADALTLHSRNFVGGFMRDPEFRAALGKAIVQITAPVLDGSRLEELEAGRKRIEATLHREYPFLLELDLKIVRDNARLIASYGAAFFAKNEGLHPERPRLDDRFQHHIQLRVYDRPDGPIVIANMLHQPIIVKGAAAWCASSETSATNTSTGRYTQLVSLGALSSLGDPPLGEVARVELGSEALIGATPLGGRATRMEIGLPPEIANATCDFEVTTQRPGTAEVRSVRVSRRIPYFESNPLSADGDIEAVIGRHRWLRWNERERRFEARPGRWQVNAPLVLPEKFGLRLEAGTTLAFAPGAYLVVRGPLDIFGNVERPVSLEASEENRTWKGIYVLASARPSHWQHVQVRGTTALEDGYLALTGAVTFYRSDVTMTDVAFLGTEAEDALNVVHSRFRLDTTTVRDARSDGFDCDFCEGSIVDSTFVDIGGDAVDVSGTRAELEGVRIEGVRDKALSVGEGSDVVVRNLKVHDAGTGIASKDSSRTRVNGAEIERVRVAGLMSYVKKPAYGPASIDALDVTFGPEVDLPVIAQTGSSVTLNGVAVDPRDLDVDRFYKDGPMQK